MKTSVRVSLFKATALIFVLGGVSIGSIAATNTAHHPSKAPAIHKQHDSFIPVIKRYKHARLPQIQAPSMWVFAPFTITVGQAVVEILKMTPYQLAPHLSAAIKAKLNQKMPHKIKQIGAATPEQAIRILTGERMRVITIDRSGQQAVSGLTTIEQFAQTHHKTVRVSYPLVLKGLSASPTIKQLETFNQKHQLHFYFNGKTQVVAIAQTPKIAKALSQNPRCVYFAVAGQSLLETIKRWAKDDGVKLYWQSHRNMMIAQSGVFFGRLSAPHGPLAQILGASHQSGINVRAEFTNNGALLIKPDHYSSMFLTPKENRHE